MTVLASSLSSRLFLRLGVFVEQHSLGQALSEAVFILDSERDLRRRPDVAFVSKERWPLDRPLPETGDWRVVPDLAVEVISPNDDVESLFEKLKEYFRYNVRQVWIVLPREQEVLVFDSPTAHHTLTAGQDLDGGDIIPGFRLSLAELFKKPVAAEA
ncbi:MAG: Uma2 family endonuclease [Gemmataceae bacterium]|nr:Uma2 family endonuclease [Gemmataceae bacterium]